MKYTAQHILRLEKKGQFPRRIKIGERQEVWRSDEVLAWLDQRGSRGGDTVAARMRKHVAKVLTSFLGALRMIPARKS